MKNILKRTVCLFLTFAMLFTLTDLSVFPKIKLSLNVSAVDAASGSCGAVTNTGGKDSVTWSYDSGVLTITGEGAMETFDIYDIPWREHKKNITSIYIDSNVTSITDSAFNNAENLLSVTFGKDSKLEIIDSNAFIFCGKLGEINIPSEVKSIGQSAFFKCESLSSVTFGENSKLEVLGDSSFMDCKKLTEINIPAGVKTIGEYSFQECESMSSVIFGEGSKLETIGEGAFEKCVEIKEIKIPDSVKTIGKYAFSACSKLIRFNVPDSVTEIEGRAFTTCTALSSVTFGENSKLETIGVYAFESCENLAEITIPDRVKNIGEYAFNKCTALNSFKFGENSKLETIGKYTFNKCENLTDISIPDSVKTIGEFAFNRCTALSSVTFGEKSKLENIEKYAFSYCIDITELVIPKKVKSIGEKAFAECEKLSSVTFEEGSELKTIGDYAFDYCIVLSSVKFAQGTELETIGEGAFNNCMGFEEFDIPNSVTTIGKGAFASCCNIDTVRISGNVKSIGSNAFISATVRHVIYGGTEAEWETLKTACGKNNDDIFKYPDVKFAVFAGTCGDGVTWEFDRNSGTLMIDGAGNIADYESVNAVPWGFFMNSIKNVEIRGDITKFGDKAFDFSGKVNFYCFSGSLAEAYAKENGMNIVYGFKTKLVCYTINGNTLDIFKANHREFPGTVAADYSIPEDAFKDMNTVKSAVIEEGVIGIGKNAFAGCSALESVIVPESIKVIDSTAFEGCNDITAYCKADGDMVITLWARDIKCGFYIKDTALGYIYDLDGTLTVLKIRDGENTVISGCMDEFSYTGYDKDTAKLVIKDGVTGIGDMSLSSMNMTSVDIADSVKTISGSAFRYCSNLESVKIPEGVETLSIYTFADCTSLKSVELPASLKTLEPDVFQKCPVDMKISGYCNLNTENLWDRKDHITLSHSYVYTADGDTITAVCANDSVHTASVKISAENAVFDGEEHKTAIIDASAWTYGELLKPSEITYTGDTSKCGEVTAGFTVGEGETAVTASVKYSIGHKLTASPAVEASCTESGTAAYWTCECCKKNFADEECTKELESIAVPAKGHMLIPAAASAVQCEADGNTAYFTCSACGKFFADESGLTEIEKDSWILTATGHSYGEASYTWTKDADGAYSCKAEKICANNAEHVISETVKASSVKTAPTCTVNGSVEYTAKFENETFEVQTKTEIIEATGSHSFKDGKCIVCGEIDPDYKEPAVTDITTSVSELSTTSALNMPVSTDNSTATTIVDTAITAVSTESTNVTASTSVTTTIIAVTTAPPVTDIPAVSVTVPQTALLTVITAPAVTTVIIPVTTTAITTAAVTASAENITTAVSAPVTETTVIVSETPISSEAVSEVTSDTAETETTVTSIETVPVPDVTTAQSGGTEPPVTTADITETTSVPISTTAVSNVTSEPADTTQPYVDTGTSVTTSVLPVETIPSEQNGITVVLKYDVNNDSDQWYNTDSVSFTANGIAVTVNGEDVKSEADIIFEKTPDEIFDGKTHDYNISFTVRYNGEQYSGTMPVKIALRGDANMDNKVDLYDAIFISKKLIRKDETPFEKFLCDNNRNGKTDLYDAINIAKLILPSVNGDWSKLPA